MRCRRLTSGLTSGAATWPPLPGWPHGPGNRLLIGDFNATYDHAEFRALLDGGPDGRKMVDVGTAAGMRLVPTWPMEGPVLPGIAIDHLVTSPGIAGSGYAVAACTRNGPRSRPRDAYRPGCRLTLLPAQACLRMSLCVAACATGRITIWSRLTWCGAVTA